VKTISKKIIRIRHLRGQKAWNRKTSLVLGRAGSGHGREGRVVPQLSAHPGLQEDHPFRPTGGHLIRQWAGVMCLCASLSSCGHLFSPWFGRYRGWAFIRAWAIGGGFLMGGLPRDLQESPRIVSELRPIRPQSLGFTSAKKMGSDIRGAWFH